MSVSTMRQVFCVGEPFAQKQPLPTIASNDFGNSCSLDSVQISIDSDHLFVPVVHGSSPQGADFPPNVICKIVELVGPKEHKALHRVNRAWRDAVCQGIHMVAPSSYKADMLARFPKVKTLGWENVAFSCTRLAQQTQLTSLTLQNCTFKPGNSIADFAALKGLKKLRLRDVSNTVERDMDGMISNLTNLTALELMRGPSSIAPVDRQTMQLPTLAHLSSLHKLQELQIQDAYQGMRMSNLSQLSHLSHLRRLAIAKISVDNIVVRAICNLPNMTCVEIPDCYSITNSALPDLGQMQGLTRLDLRWSNPLHGVELSDEGMLCLAPLTNMVSLNLAGHAGVTSVGLGFLADFVHLTSLCLAGLPLHLGGADFLEGLTNLQTLNLSKTLLAVPQLEFLGGLDGLKSLNLSETYFGDAAACQLANKKDLETLKLSYCPLGNAGLETILATCPGLRRVTVEGCWLSTMCVFRAVRRFPSLKLWAKDDSRLPRWMRKVDVVLIAQIQPYSRRLRVLYQGEDSLGMTMAVGLGVVFFTLFYAILMLLLFGVVAFFPLCLLGIASVGVGVCSIVTRSVRGTEMRPPRLLVRLEQALNFEGPIDRRSRQDRLADLV